MKNTDRDVIATNEPAEGPAPPRPPQFGLRALMTVVTGVAVFFAAGVWFGPPGYFLALLFASGALLASRKGPSLVRQLALVYVVAVVLLTMLAALMLPAMQNPRGRPRSPCCNNLKCIGLALQTYHETWKCFPPAYTVDEQGKPMHSWRVLILPYLEQRALYNRYDFSEPWDGPHNLRLAATMPSVFRCPNDAAAKTGATSYVAVVGAETAWPGSASVSIHDITDGTSNTIVVVEASGSGINWMEPRDLPFAVVKQGVNSPLPGGIRSAHPGCVLALNADGSARAINQGISNDTLEGA